MPNSPPEEPPWLLDAPLPLTEPEEGVEGGGDEVEGAVTG